MTPGVDWRDDRGVTPVLAVVLIVGMVAVGSIVVLVASGTATNDAKEGVENERVEKGLRQLDSRVDSVARSDDATDTVNLDLPGNSDGVVRETNVGRIVINQTNVTTGRQETLVDQSLGAVVYDDGETQYALQAGGLWRGTGNRTQMVSPPAFGYETTDRGTEPTLTVPIVATEGDRRLTSDQVRVSKNETISPLNDVSVVEGELVILRLTSDYYVGWADYFSEIAPGTGIELDHANRTVIVRMVVPVKAPPVEGGVVSGAAQGTLKLKQDARLDSYNSSNGDYASTRSSDTEVVAGNDIVLQQNASVEGNLVLGGDGRFKQDAEVEGNLSHEDDSSLSFHSSASDHVDGWIRDDAAVQERTAVDGVIDRNVGRIRENNDNSSAANVTDGTLGGCDTSGGPGCWLSAGNYFLEEIDLGTGDRLMLDTTGGKINIVVTDDIDLDDGTIKVIGSNRVNVYLDGETGSEDFAMKQDATVKTPDQDATQFWLYMDASAEAKLRQSSDFTGVLYGPGHSGREGAYITMSSTSDEIHVYGAVVGATAPITQEVKVHYDEALINSDPIQTTVQIPRLTFLHVSVHRVDVEND